MRLFRPVLPAPLLAHIKRQPYATALVLSGTFILLRHTLEPLLEGNAPLMALLAAPLLASMLSGFRSGLFAGIVCAIAGSILFIGPAALRADLWAESARIGIFLVYSISFSWMVHSRTRAVTRLAAEHQLLSKAERRARETLEASPAGMLLVNRQGAIELANTQAVRLFGYSREELIGGRIDDLVPGDQEKHARQRADHPTRLMARAVDSGGELFARRKDGSVFPVEIGLNPLGGDQEGLVLASVLDITQRRQAELAVIEASRRKDEFISVLAHELRNPLAPIGNALEIMKRLDSSEPHLQRTREIIGRQVRHMARLIDDLLDVSRIARGKLLLRKQNCDLASMALQVAGDFRFGMERAGLTLVVEQDAAPLWIQGDPVRLAQMISNLLANAERFSHSGGSVRLQVGRERGGQLARIRVIDQGIGMDADTLARIFTPFEQAAQDIGRPQGGLGLGLALTKMLAELHGGSVSAHSPGLGKGAIFTLCLPTLPTQEMDAPRQRDGPVSTSKPLDILVIEDSPDAAETLSQLLMLMGHRVRTCMAGEEGVRAAHEMAPQAVISDIGLPGAMDGYEVGRTLRSDARFTGTTLIALSGYADEAARNKSKLAGFDHHLAKPADLEAMVNVLAAVKRPGPRRTSVPEPVPGP